MFFAVREGDLNRADSLNHLDAGGANYTVVFPLMRAYQEKNLAEQQRLWPIYLRQTRAIGDPAKTGGPVMPGFMFLFMGDLDNAEQALAAAADSARSPAERIGVTFLSAEVMAARGRPRAALAAFPTQVPNRLDVWGQTLFEPFRHPARDELLRFRDDVLRADSDAGKSQRGESVTPQIRLYWAALANCQLGNIAQAMQQAQQIEALPVPEYWSDAMRALATDVRAFADVAQGDANSALRRIESIAVGVPLDLVNTPADRSLETLWHGELLYRAGRYDEALQWFENTIVNNGLEIIPFYLLRRAQILDRRGDTRQAALLYAQFLEDWKNAEPELQPLVREARGRLATIQRKVD